MTRKKACKEKSAKDRKIEFLEEHMEKNTLAIKEGPKKKSWSVHDLKSIKPITTPQRMMFESFMMGNHIVATGCAGTGKTYCALYLALNELLEKKSKCDKIIIVRSILAVKDIGFLPGSIEEKIAPYEVTYQDIVQDLLKSGAAYDSLKENNQLEFKPTSFVRGLTWDNCIVILDEIQNYQDSEINSVFTRIGENSKIIVCGDIEQNDLVAKHGVSGSGYDRMIRTCQKMPSIDIIDFREEDIVRSDFVREWIIARNNS